LSEPYSPDSRVRAAFCAASLRPSGPFVRTAFIAAFRRSTGPLVRTALRAAERRLAGPRLRAADLVCRESASWEAAARGSRFSAPATALERRGDDTFGVLIAVIGASSDFGRRLKDSLPQRQLPIRNAQTFYERFVSAGRSLSVTDPR